ncbi:GNAT family N-acetyltransferase [Nitrosopumilus ureiphilus]|uniref:N-acetyltransferase n=1 Tax=Nitrosopumilus ureiphilus TaxID=1470067 RepID=A0A7D5M6W3_9ARCH|nr:GNAT family N-acetyltransferase [Nitrosopumilus ureiphilus]QLH06030.1 N-acetyltransferase [Nitrosopumilus ureiphilus]
MIREAKTKDKIPILKFCKNTFSWGDYIEQVWDSWLSEGNLFVFEKQLPVGICHAFYSKDQIWIEGIRIDPNFRRQKIASELVMNAELVGKEKNASLSYMLIDTQNFSSLNMAHSLDYEIFQTWNFYSLSPKRSLSHKIQFEKSLNPKFYHHYVKSWRWLPIDDYTLSQFYEDKKIIKSSSFDNDSIAIITDSEHFDKTLIVTLFSGSENSVLEIISFLQNHAIEKNYERIQILTKEHLPAFDSLEHKISFHLMKKSLV